MMRRVFKFLLGVAVLLVLVLAGFRLAAHFRETTPLGVDLPTQGRLIQTSEGQIFVLEHGDPEDPALLFAHGTAAWSGLWQPTLRALSKQGYHSIGYDLPPFGFSEHASDGDYSRQRQAARIIALLEAMDTKPILVAHSVGAGPAAEAVMLRPELVSGLIVVGGAIALNSHKTPTSLPGILSLSVLRQSLVSASAANPLLTGYFLRSFMYRDEAATDEIVDVLKIPMTRHGYTKAVSEWVPSLLVSPDGASSTQEQHWQALALPTAFIWGTKDDVTPLFQGQELHTLVPGSKLLVLDDVGHIPQIEDPAAFRAALAQALAHIRSD